MTPPPSTGLDDLIAEFLLAAERGAAPDPAEWLARHPEHAAELALFLADLGHFESFLGLPSAASADLTTDYRAHGASAAPALPRGERFGEYDLLGIIGRGGMGTVYRARLAGTSLVVALKTIRSDGPGGVEADRDFREEIEVTTGLRHPNIVPVYYVGEHAGQQFYTMALVEGGSLDLHLGRLSGDPEAAAALLAKVARAVHYAHQRGFLHCDLKPANILVDAAGQPHVADFGLAARLCDSGTATQIRPAGSLPWMAPEAVRGEPTLTTAVDVWALGVILYELLTGTRPFRGANREYLQTAILEQEPIPPRQLNPRLPRPLGAICLRCLQKNPEDRYESATAVALELERWLRDDPVREWPETRWERFSRWVRRNPGLAASLFTLVAILAAGAGAGLSFMHDQDRAVRQAVCQANEYAAGHVANSVLRRLDDFSITVVEAARDPELQKACARGDPDAVQAALQSAFAPPAGRASPFASVYVLNSDGHIVALVNPGAGSGPRPDISAPSLPTRDYFLGARRNLSKPPGRDQVHVSRVFASVVDGKDKLALSCPITTVEAQEPWVLAATITTNDTLGLLNLHGQQHKAVLIAPRDASSSAPGHVILVHPAFVPGNPAVPFGRATAPVTEPDSEPELRLATAAAPAPLTQNEDYRDPVVDHGHPEYAGRWLTGSARVGHTELVVLVQQRYDDAVSPHRSYVHRFLAWVGGAIGAGVVLVLVLRLVRSLRRRPRIV